MECGRGFQPLQQRQDAAATFSQRAIAKHHKMPLCSTQFSGKSGMTLIKRYDGKII
jgi:hypothetical protein